MLVAWAVVALSLSQVDVDPRSEGPVQLHAEQCDVVAQRQVVCSGAARLRRPGAELRAERFTYDRDTSRAKASGGVRLVLTEQGLHAAIADEVELVLDGEEVTEVFLTGGKV